MTESPDPAELSRLKANTEKLSELNLRLLKALAGRKPAKPAMQGPGPQFYAESMSAFLNDAMANPARIFEQQVSLWGESLQNWINLQDADKGDKGQAHARPKDNRFSDDLWNANPYFRLLRDQYRSFEAAVTQSVEEMGGVDDRQRRRLDFFSRQLVAMMSPANFLATNPVALERAVETEGESLVRGLENLVRDLEKNDGELLVTLADPDAFEVGGNLATTEGAVVFRNELLELIQYTPRTAEAHRIPIVIVPPWINKYYILDLKPENSFIRWVVEQGFTVFVVSWVNPGTEHRDVGMDSYALDGCIAAVRATQEITGEDQVNAVGYCIGGTLLALVLAYMAKTGDKSIRSATFLTTLADFAEMADLGVFIEDGVLEEIEREVEEKGFLPSIYMARTFSYMRANDLVYGPAVRSYMMGEPPPAFDLLFWNGDSTNMPARMTVEYLRRLCQNNEFSDGGFNLLGETVSLRDVRHPLFAIACETDHIANWPGAYSSIAGMRSRDKTFILSQSGHIAGIVNPPARNRYGHYIGARLPKSPDAWRRQAEFREGSWWRRWSEWLARRSGAKFPARAPGGENGGVLGPAPGSYVLESG